MWGLIGQSLDEGKRPAASPRLTGWMKKCVRLLDNIFRTAPIARAHLEQVVSLLQELYDFGPSPGSYGAIWTRFSDQANPVPLVVMSEELVVAFRVPLVENKVRGGKMGRIEEVVSHPEKRGMGGSAV